MKTIKQVRRSYYIENNPPADVTKNHGWKIGGGRWQAMDQDVRIKTVLVAGCR